MTSVHGTTFSFPSHAHPGESPAPFVYGSALTRPLAFCLLIVMIAATALVLLQQDALPFVSWAGPAALIISIGYTVFRLRSIDAELLIQGDKALVRSVWDVATNAYPPAEPLVPPRKTQTGIDVGIGRDVLSISPDEWPNIDEIFDALLLAAPPATSDSK